MYLNSPIHCTHPEGCQNFLFQLMMSAETVVHNGGCHCRRVRWQAEAPSSVIACTCNCSNCSMRATTHFVVSNSKFKLMEESKQFLTTYSFGTHSAKHIFCKVCGITSFYIQRGNPDGVAIVISCVDPGTLNHYEIKHFDGKHLLQV